MNLLRFVRPFRLRSGLLLVVIVGALAAASAPAESAGGPTLYVDGSNAACTNSGTGTQAQPFCTISAAAAKVSAGQTVQVASGTYPEQVTVPKSGTSSAPIVFTAAPGASVTVTGQVNGFYVSGRSWVTINGFNVTSTSDNGITVSSSSFVTVSNNHVSYAGFQVQGMVKGGIRINNSTDSLVVGNTADHNSYAGIMVVGGSTRVEVRNNTTFANAQGFQRAAPGIRIYAAVGNVVDGNISHDNEDSGIESYPGANNTLIYNNVCYNNGDHGIDDLGTTGQVIVGNSVYNNVTAGINLEGNSTGGTVENNVAVNNGIRSPRTHSDIRIEHGSTAGTTVDYNLVYLTTPDTLLIWDSVNYTTLAAYQAASGQMLHGLNADPKWRNPAAGDFHLTAGSPAIDSADSWASGQPSSDVEGNPRVDDPATTNTGIGPRSYDDRGAYEFQPGGGSDSAPAAALSVTPASGPVPLAVNADASASTDGDATPIATYSFDFGDGSAAVGPQASATASHTYATAGTYTVTVTVTDTAGLSSTATAQVSASTLPVDSPPASALAVTPGTGPAPLAVTADASASTDTDSTPIASYSFDFGDGSAAVGPQAGATASHTYAVAGTYTVTVTVTDTAGLSSTATAQVSASTPPADSPPAAALAVTPASGPAPLAATADASASTDTDSTPIASYSFDFGDGSAAVGPQAGATASHTYATAGTYTVTVTVTDTAGLSSTATAQVVARAATNLVRNPGFETDLSGWNTSGSDANISLARATGGHTGGWAAQLTNTGSTASTCLLNDSPNWVTSASSLPYTGSLWVRAAAPGAILKLRFREYTGSTLNGTGTSQITLTTSWQQISLSYTPIAPGATLDFNAYVSKAAPGNCFYADDVSISAG